MVSWFGAASPDCSYHELKRMEAVIGSHSEGRPPNRIGGPAVGRKR